MCLRRSHFGSRLEGAPLFDSRLKVNMMVPLRFVGLLLSVAVAAVDVSPGVIAADDECTADGGACALNALQMRGEAAKADEVEDSVADTFPDLSTGFDIPGPYLEEPDEAEAESPRAAIKGWENATSLRQLNTWGDSFCESHHTGYFCDGTTRVRCCHQSWGFVKCGTTVHSTNCGWHGGGGGYYPGGGGGYYPRRRVYPGGGSWHIHPGWHESSFCRSHHVGWFCASHHKVHCCNDYGHFVDCTTTTESTYRC